MLFILSPKHTTHNQLQPPKPLHEYWWGWGGCIILPPSPPLPFACLSQGTTDCQPATTHSREYGRVLGRLLRLGEVADVKVLDVTASEDDKFIRLVPWRDTLAYLPILSPKRTNYTRIKTRILLLYFDTDKLCIQLCL